MADYRPIACSLHDELQLRAMRRSTCSVEWSDESGAPRSIRGVVVDVFARDGVEYLKLDDGLEIRLDRLARVDGVEFTDADC